MSNSDFIFMSMVQFSTDALKRMDANLSIHGISYTEYQVLFQLSQSPTSTMPRIELARSVGRTASGVTRILAPMEKLGMVRKESHPRDARKSLVALTDAGKTLLEDSTTTVEHVADSMLEGLSKTQQDALERLFAR